MARQLTVQTQHSDPARFQNYMRTRSIFAAQLPLSAPAPVLGEIVHFMNKGGDAILASGRVIEVRPAGAFNVAVSEYYL